MVVETWITKPCFKTPLILQEYDKEHWFLVEPLVYVTMHLGYPWRIEVQSLFATDLASIPHLARPIIRRGGTHKAAVVHDWLTTRNPDHNAKGKDNITRRDADKIFREALRVSSVPSWKTTIMYHGVRAYSFWERQ